MIHISDNIDKLIGAVFAKQHPLLPKMISNWHKIVGMKFSKISNPVRITSLFEKGQKLNVLHVNIEDSASSTELIFQQEIIIERIAVYLGFQGIHKLKFKISLTKPKL